MIIDLGLIDYEKAYKVQKDFVKRRRLGEIEDSVVIAEHPPVFTIGRTGKEDNLLVDEDFLRGKNIRFLRVDRGGDITFHGPGQLVAYPIIDLKNRKKDLHQYLRALEDVAINFLQEYSVLGQKMKDRTGVWVDNRKIAFIGVAASNWITYHGVSININVDLKFFSMMRPCGMKDIEATSLNVILNRNIDTSESKRKLLSCFHDLFGL